MTDLDIREMANIEWEPWGSEDVELPTNSEIANPHMVMVRLAYGLMYKTKPELIEALKSFEGDDILEETIERMGGAASVFEGLSEMLKGAHARLLLAWAALAEQEEGGA